MTKEQQRFPNKEYNSQRLAAFHKAFSAGVGVIIIKGKTIDFYPYGDTFVDGDISIALSTEAPYTDTNGVRESLIRRRYANTHPSRHTTTDGKQPETLRVRDIVFRTQQGELTSSPILLTSLLPSEIDSDTPIIIVSSQFVNYLTKNNRIQTSPDQYNLSTLQDASPVFEVIADFVKQGNE